jgi:hypothetical protein
VMRLTKGANGHGDKVRNNLTFDARWWSYIHFPMSAVDVGIGIQSRGVSAGQGCQIKLTIVSNAGWLSFLVVFRNLARRVSNRSSPKP